MSIKSNLICSLALGGILLIGCKKEEPPPKAQPKTPAAPTTMPTTKPSGPTTAPSTGGGGAASGATTKPSGDPTAAGSGSAQIAGDTVRGSLPNLSPATRPIDLSSLGGPATNPSQPVLNK